MVFFGDRNSLSGSDKETFSIRILSIRQSNTVVEKSVRGFVSLAKEKVH